MPTDVCPARTKDAMLLKMKITRSCPNNAKPNVTCIAFVAPNRKDIEICKAISVCKMCLPEDCY